MSARSKESKDNRGLEQMRGEVLNVDVAIIGSGGAGLAAAIEARDAGARVAIIEQSETLGGTSIISGGGCFIVGTPLQESYGIQDTPDDAFEDWVKWGKGSADEVWARFYIEHSLYDVYFWAERLGIKWVELWFMEGNRALRWHRPENNGLGLTTALIDAVRRRGVGDLFTSTAANGILMQDGRAAGVTTIDLKTGEASEIRAKSVVTASGGFAGNLDRLLDARPDLRRMRIMEGGGFGATGTGHKLLSEAGAYLTHMDLMWFYAYATPDYRDPTGRRGLAVRGIPGYVWINQQGRRFHNEWASGGATGTPALMSQDPPHAWAIIDAPMAAQMQIADPYYLKGEKVLDEKVRELLENSPYIRKADSFSELGRKMGVDLASFLSTIKRYNQACESGLEKEPEFGRPLKECKKLDTAPFYGIQFFPMARKTFGGVKTDLRCRVLDRHFEAVPGLYAAGEVAGMAGGHINGAAGLEGTMLGPAIFSGRVAGAWAAQEAGFGPGFSGRPNRPGED
jgi:flavocytochrome c